LKGYRPQLDSLRAFAVTAVLLAHFWAHDTELSVLGVRLFFVLSGYLLTSILLRERDDARHTGVPLKRVLGDFYARRILRIWPAYYAALIIATVLGAGSIAATFAWHALFASNILFFLEQRWYPMVTAHLWTLSVEEQFYLVLPLLLLFPPRKMLAPILIGCVVAALIYRVVVGLAVSPPLDFYVVLPIAQLDALAGGALLSLAQRLLGSLNWRLLLAWSFPTAIILQILPFPEGFDFAVTAPVWLLPMLAIVAGADAGIGGAAGKFLDSRPIVALGRISYGVYLYHVFVAAGFDKVADLVGFARLVDGPLRFLLLFVLTIAVATASWLVLERPALSLRQRFRTASGGGPVVPAAPSRI